MKNPHTPAPDEWVFPRLGAYRLICCDCGLVHEFDFAVIERFRDKSCGDGEYLPLLQKQGHLAVAFRVRRNEPETQEIRRSERIKITKRGRPR